MRERHIGLHAGNVLEREACVKRIHEIGMLVVGISWRELGTSAVGHAKKVSVVDDRSLPRISCTD